MAMKFNLDKLKKINIKAPDVKDVDYKKLAKDFWYGKPHTAEEGGRRLGEIQMDKTGLYYHR